MGRWIIPFVIISTLLGKRYEGGYPNENSQKGEEIGLFTLNRYEAGYPNWNSQKREEMDPFALNRSEADSYIL